MTFEQTGAAVQPQATQAVVHCSANLSDEDLLQRFSDDRDSKAFECLVRRHGPLVLSVCRRMLRDAHAADDAFQATFLVLVRRAASIRQPELLGSWLYAVAFRTASRARAKAMNRHKHEMRTATTHQPAPNNDIDQRELRVILDEEISRLPKKYREPLVLCYLQERTHAEAAQLLGCPVGSMSSRLAMACEKLRSRLSRRGFSLTAGLFTVILLESTVRSEVSNSLVCATVRNALLAATRQTALQQPCRSGLLTWREPLSETYRPLSITIVALLLAAAASLLTYRAVTFTEARGMPSRQPVMNQVELELPMGVSVFGSVASDAQHSPSVTIYKPSSCRRKERRDHAKY